MGRKRKQFPSYEEPDAKLARADSEGDVSENGMLWGITEPGGCDVTQLPALDGGAIVWLTLPQLRKPHCQSGH